MRGPLHAEWEAEVEAEEAEEEANCGERNEAIHSVYVDSYIFHMRCSASLAAADAWFG